MSDKFNGFSQDEIKKLSGNREVINKKSNADTATSLPIKPKGLRRMPDKASNHADQLIKKQVGNRIADSAKITAAVRDKNENQQDEKGENDETLNLNHSMSKSLEDALFFAPLKMQKKDGTAAKTEAADDSSILKMADTLPINNNNLSEDSSILPSSSSDAYENHEIITDSPFKGISLKDFEEHRKIIEEQNKQKKQLLYKAIEKHTQKTAAETRKLEEIRQELSKLETDLAVDVALLRKQIDAACIHFSNIEKQYMKIEAEFLKAKVNLHSASEKKELLTEHLCTVIAHNEDRKAQKLSELMQKVGLASDDELFQPVSPEK